MTRVINYHKDLIMIVFSSEDFAKFVKDTYKTPIELGDAAVEVRMTGRTYYGVLVKNVVIMPTQFEVMATAEYKGVKDASP